MPTPPADALVETISAGQIAGLAGRAAEARDLDENTLLDVDEDGPILGTTVEHAS